MDQESNTSPEQKSSVFGSFSRRKFLGQIGAAGITATVASRLQAQQQEPKKSGTETPEDSAPGAMPVTLKVNGRAYHLKLDPRASLLDTLRENLSLTGTKKGCDHGQCGACTVHVNGMRVNSCLTFAVMHQGDEITTVEGLGTPDNMHPVQKAFVEHDAYQCGACTSGQIMSASALLKEPWAPKNMSPDDVKQHMYGNICRCGAYPNIVAAVQQAQREV